MPLATSLIIRWRMVGVRLSRCFFLSVSRVRRGPRLTRSVTIVSSDGVATAPYTAATLGRVLLGRFRGGESSVTRIDYSRAGGGGQENGKGSEACAKANNDGCRTLDRTCT